MLTIRGADDVQIVIEPTATDQRDALLAEALEITAVANNFDQESAVDVLARLEEMARGIEKARKAVKEPVLDVGRRIDSVARGFSEQVEAEAGRLGKLIAAYRQSLQAAIAKKEQEEREKRQKLIGEANSKVAELDAAASQASTPEELQSIEAQKTELVAETTSALVQSKQAEANAKLRPAGIVERGSWKYEVDDIGKVFAARPDLCLIEPNGSAIRGAIKAGLRQCPGLRIFKDSKVTTRRAA